MTCWRRLRDWEQRGVWLKIWRIFLGELIRKGQLNWSEAFIDGSFASAKNAWLENFRHLVVRYDRLLRIYDAFFHIACFMIALRRS